MSEPTPQQVTLLLQAAAAGEEQASRKLLPLVYDQLRALARARMRIVPPGNTLQPTALVHEAYSRLVADAGDEPSWPTRGRFFAAAATAMRDILVEQARRKSALKHGGGRRREDISEGVAGDDTPQIESPAEDVLALDQAVRKLSERDPRKGQVVMLKYFAGMETRHIALALGVSDPTVERDWTFAKAWLKKELAQREAGPQAAGGAEQVDA